jgi:hypothetical protein
MCKQIYPDTTAPSFKTLPNLYRPALGFQAKGPRWDLTKAWAAG